MRRLATVVLLASAVLLGGCGGGDDDGGRAAATASPAPAAGAPLDEDALLLVHDELVGCAQQEDALGLVAHLSGDKAVSDSEGAGGGVYDDTLAAPKATVSLTGAGGVQFVGLRADTRNHRGTSDVDVLIFRSEEEAAKGAETLGEEASGAAQSGLFVNVPLHKGSDTTALERCEGEARP